MARPNVELHECPLLDYSSLGVLLVDAHGTVSPMMMDPCANK